MKLLELGSGLDRFPALNRLLQNGTVFQQKISVLTCCILLGITAWILGQLVWFIQPSEQSVTPWKASISSSNRQQASLDISALQKGNIFGAYNQAVAPVVEQPIVTDAPKTRLNLVLVGAVSSSNPKLSLAVIANRGKQATYGINEEIEGTRAKLKAVLIDRVIIDNSGRDETLMLDGREYKKLSAASQVKAKPTPSNRGNNPSSVDKLSEIKAIIAKDPQQLFQYVRLSQVKRDGNVLGYRVSPGKAPELFKSVGLESGDIATQLNGNDLTDPAAMGKVFRTLQEQSELSITVERDGQQHDIFIEF